MPAPEPEPLEQLLNSILSEVVDSKDRSIQQLENHRLRAVWEASERSDEFRRFGEASAVGLDTFDFQDVLRFMLVIGYRLRSAELESSGLERQGACHLHSVDVGSSTLEGQTVYGLHTTESESSVLEAQTVYGLHSAELESSDLERQKRGHTAGLPDRPDRQTHPNTCPGNSSSAASSQLLSLESARTRFRSVDQGLYPGAMTHHVRGRISLWRRSFSTLLLKVIRTDSFLNEIYCAYQKRHPHKTESKVPLLVDTGFSIHGDHLTLKTGLGGPLKPDAAWQAGTNPVVIDRHASQDTCTNFGTKGSSAFPKQTLPPR